MEDTQYAAKDPLQAIYDGLAEQARQDVLKKPHDKTTWRYHRRPPLRFRASESGACPRRIWYRLMGYVPTPDDPGLILKQLDGNLAQDVVRQLMLEHGVRIEGIEFRADGTQVETLDTIKECEAPDGTKIKVSARADGKLATPRGWALFEFKTLKHFDAMWLDRAYQSGYKGGETGTMGIMERVRAKLPYYEAQMQITMHVFDETLTYFGTKDKGYSSYGWATPDGGRSGAYMEYDEERVAGILAMFAEVQQAVQDEKPPDYSHPLVPSFDGGGQCGWCPFHYQCHGAKSRGEVVYPE